MTIRDLELHRLYRGPIAGGDGSTEGDIDPDEVLAALERQDKGEPPEPKTPVKPAAKPAAAPVAAATTTDPVVWELVEENIKETCPDLDDADLVLARAAAGNSPKAFKAAAKQMQAKITAAKEGVKKPAAGGETPEELAAKLGREVFSGGTPGGDRNMAQVTPPEGDAQQKLDKAVKAGDTRGIMRGLAQTAQDKKLFERGITLVED